MEKRALLAVVLSIAVFYVFSTFIMPPPPKQPVKGVQQQTTSAAAAHKDLAQSPAMPPAGIMPAPVMLPSGLPVKDIKVETDFYRATFSTRG